MSDKKVILGLVAGGLIAGGLVAFLTGTEEGKRLKERASDKLRDLKSQAEDLFDEFGERTEEAHLKVAGQYAELTNCACDLFDSFKSEYRKVCDNDDLKQGLLIGGVVGLVAGVGTAILVSEGIKSCSCPLHKHACSCRRRDWKKLVLSALNGLENRSFLNRENKSISNSIDQLLDFAQVGAKMWKTFRS